ncbi:Protein SRG1 [Dendrobium catenatum]|uniref:Protein SRG1 n=1 Tax=Dendrobium catenatum TaxID=906689 RepID=A0A2I0X0R7_9ASPA|nr:Protein SRG1 [Dendrobium catenatum]
MGSKSTNPLELGRSLPVPNVQELAQSDDQIPERYYRPEADVDPVASIDEDELPVIDLMKLLNPELIDKDELFRLGSACREWGFFQCVPFHYRDTLDTYTLKIGKVVDCLYGLMAEDLGVDLQDMLNIFRDQIQSVRINYYPPCKQANKVLGLSPHSDGIALTVLLQANDVHALQIKKNDKWLLVKPKPSALIINIGDMMEIMTNGKYKSIEHRAIINIEERLSIATFHLPSIDVLLRPFPGLVNSNGELYKTISAKEYTREYFAGKLNGKNALESMKLRK